MPTFTVHHGRRYRATVKLSFLEQVVSNAEIVRRLTAAGFDQVEVTGKGTRRQVTAHWPGADVTADLEPHLSEVVELPA